MKSSVTFGLQMPFAIQTKEGLFHSESQTGLSALVAVAGLNPHTGLSI